MESGTNHYTCIIVFLLQNSLEIVSENNHGNPPEHVSEAERCDAQLNIPLCVHALRSDAHGQS